MDICLVLNANKNRMKFCGNLPGQIQNIDVCLENAAFFPKGCDNRVNFQDMFWKDKKIAFMGAFTANDNTKVLITPVKIEVQ